MKLTVFFILSCLLLLAAPLAGKERCADKECISCHHLSRGEAEEILRPLGVKIKSIGPSRIKGLFEIEAERDGKKGLVFVDYARRHLMQGVMANISGIRPIPPVVSGE